MTKPTYEQLEARLEMVGELASVSEKLLEGAQKAYQAQAEELVAAGKAIEKLAAENVGLKAGIAEAYDEMEQLDGGHFSTDADGQPLDTLIPLVNAQDAIQRLAIDIKTPATDAALAEIRAQARVEGINFAASRLAAAFNHGFVDKPMPEVGDVVRMILTAKEDLANNPAEDGLSGEYAEQSLKDWEQQLRGEASK